MKVTSYGFYAATTTLYAVNVLALSINPDCLTAVICGQDRVRESTLLIHNYPPESQTGLE